MPATTLIVRQLIDIIRQEPLPVGTHLAAQKLADRLRVSRSPVNEALRILHESGIVARQANRGYFVAQDLSTGETDPALLEALTGGPDAVTRAYFAIADDLLRGSLPMQCTESLLRATYELTAAQTQALLNRIVHEGWVSRKPGYGWAFSSMMTTAETLLQSYRLRLAVEPAALLEPGYRVESAVIERCRHVELQLLQGGIVSNTADQMHDRGVGFHESLVEASGNPFFIDSVRRVNKIRRLLSYRSMRSRERYRESAEQHLEILRLLELGLNEQASAAMRAHLVTTLKNLGSIRDILKSRTAAGSA